MCIIDIGVDSHVGGREWLVFVDINGPNIKHVNVVGFEEKDIKKLGLPVVDKLDKITNSVKVFKLICT